MRWRKPVRRQLPILRLVEGSWKGPPERVRAPYAKDARTVES